MYKGIKRTTGIPSRKTAPLKTKTWEPITDKARQLDRWVEHYLELYSRESTITQTALDALKSLATMNELDSTPTAVELDIAIDALSPRKAPGQDASQQK